MTPARPDLWRHVKSGRIYERLVRIAYVESAPINIVVVYRSVDDGVVWTRPYHEFHDGRFVVDDDVRVAAATRDELARRIKT